MTMGALWYRGSLYVGAPPGFLRFDTDGDPRRWRSEPRCLIKGVERGLLTQPVMNFRFNESPVQLLQNAVKLGRPVRLRGLEGAQMIVPAIVATEFSLTSVSDAV